MNLTSLSLTKRRLELMEKMEIRSVEDLLKTYPYRYETVQSTPFSSWKEQDSVCFEGLICKQAYVVRLGKNRSMTKFHVISWDEDLEITLFNRPWTQQFSFGKTITIFGTYQGNNRILASNYNFKPLKEQMGMHPVYSLTEGLKQNEMQTIMDKALEHIDCLVDVIPTRFKEKYRLMNYHDAIRLIHKPTSLKDVKMALRTLKYEEFLRFYLSLKIINGTNNIQIKDKKDIDIHKSILTYNYIITHHPCKSVKVSRFLHKKL